MKREVRITAERRQEQINTAICLITSQMYAFLENNEPFECNILAVHSNTDDNAEGSITVTWNYSCGNTFTIDPIGLIMDTND